MGYGTNPARSMPPNAILPPQTPPYPMTQLIPIANIRILPTRQRRAHDPDAHTELVNSISSPMGLLHALVIRSTAEGPVLVAGERRLRAIKDILDMGGRFTYAGAQVPADVVPCNDIGTLDPLAAEEAELDENLRRLDLSWQEKVAAWGRLHDLRTAQAAAKGDTPHTVRGTAEELFGRADGDYQTKVALALNLREQLADPEVREAKSVREAVKVLERKDRERENKILAQQMDATKTPHRLLRGSCLEVSLDHVAAQVVITDPPYGMDAHEFADGGGAVIAMHTYVDDNTNFNTKVLPGIERALTHTTPQAHAYIFCDFERFYQLAVFLRGCGWNVFRTPLIWVKDNGRVPLPEHGPRRLYECILYARKGDKKVNFIGGDVLTFPADKNLGMSAQKPVALYVELLRRSARPGDTVLDPFCGTGTIFPAAAEAKCLAVGVELNETTADIAAGRLRNLV